MVYGLVVAKNALARMDAKLTNPQRLAVANVSIFNLLPQWFWTARGIGPRDADG
jgi:hypothetical protein